MAKGCALDEGGFCDRLRLMKLLKKVLVTLALFLFISDISWSKPNLILISVDTLRQDHLGIYGYDRNTSPNIDRLLKSGAWFDKADCNVPLTTPSFASLMSSRYPHETGATRNGIPMLDGMETLSEILKQNGYSTAAILSNWPLKKNLSNLQKGFDLYDDKFYEKRWLFFNDERDAKEVTSLAASWLESKPKPPFLLWAHYSEPHSPYQFHRGFVFNEPNRPDTETQTKIDAYDSEVAYADSQIGILLNKIRELKLDQNSLIVFIADHGENLGEHGYLGHGRYLYQESIRIPFGVSGPGIPSNQKIESQAELLDFAPTALGYLGIPPGKMMRGRNLIQPIKGEIPWEKNRLIYLETFPGAVRGEGAQNLANTKKPIWIGFQLNEVKLLYYIPGSRWQMLNLNADPQELKNLADPANQNFILYSDHLLKWFHSWEHSIAQGNTDALTESDRKKLEALGYLNK